MSTSVPLDPGGAPEPGRPVALSPRVVRLTAPNPGMMTGPGTNSYLVGSGQLAVVDPGPDDAGHVEALARLGEGRIRWIVVTHTHPDHAPATAALATRTGAEVLGFDARDGFEPDRTVSDGFTLSGEGFSLRAVHTPGHASNHLCWLLTEEAMVFSGDHVMGGSTVVISPPDGDMAVYLASLRRLRALDPPLATIAPGHGSLLVDPAATVDELIAHRLRREATVAEVLGRGGPATVDELLPTVYADVRDELRPVARQSLWAHLRKLADDGRARSADPDDIGSSWTATP
ncbi:MAG TPA: MBL fold metallo-hydrolase [Acidimicrobiales bacterium]|nr:MBL fold metallo-hydrolase [Acidimicrobiales bacterium]